MLTVYRIILTLIAAILCWTLMAHAWGGWNIDGCLTQVYSDPAAAPTAC